jgi:hypothetical protein
MNNINNIIKNYGIVILKKNSILYHTSSEKNLSNIDEKDKFFLFCSFHPSEYGVNSNYVHFIRLKQDVKLFFMIDNMMNNNLVFLNSSFKYFFERNKINLSIINKNKQLKFINILKTKKFNGWFSSINNTSANIEIALFNDKNLYKIIGSNELILNWNNWNGETKYFNIGNSYKITTLNYPVILIINEKYRDIITKICKKIFINKELKPRTIFNIIIHNAIILYFNKDNRIINADNAINKYI